MLKSFLRVALIVVLAEPLGAVAQPHGEALNWVYQELNGTWQEKGGAASAASGGAPGQATFQHQGGGVFRFNSNSSDALLARWNGRQLRVTGPVHSDEKGWTYFQIDGTQCRMGKRKGGLKVMELQGDKGQILEMPGS